MNDPAPSTATLATVRRSIFWVSWPFFIMTLLLPVYGQELGASVVEIGLFFSAFSLMMVLLRPVVGWAIDRFGRRPFFLLGLASYAVTMFGFAAVGQVWGIVVARILQGIASSFLWLSAHAMVADSADAAERGRSFGSIAQASSQGSILGTSIGFTLLITASKAPSGFFPLSGWQLVFLTYGAASVVAAVLAWRLPETRPRAPAGHVGRPIVWSRPWLLLLLVTLVTGASWAMVSPILIVYLQDRLDVGIEMLSWAFLPSGLVWALLPTHLGRLADRFGRKPLMILGLGMAALTSFLIPALGSIVGLAVLWAVQALCYAAGDPAEQALVADLTGGDQRGRAYGYYALAADLGATIGPFGGAWLYQSIGAASPFYVNGVILGACALLLAALLQEPRAQPLAVQSEGK